jgi:hypothetical protein
MTTVQKWAVYFELVNVYQTYVQSSTMMDKGSPKTDSCGGPIRRHQGMSFVLKKASDQ